LAFALPLVAAGYFVPLLPSLGATDWRGWTEGSWPEIARTATGFAGPLLAVWIALAGMVSALALFNALLLSYSRVPFVVADDGYLPAMLARTDTNGTPRNAVIISAIVYSIFVLIPFGDLVVADVLLYSLALSLELASLVVLRRREPQLRGAFRIPLGANGVAALAMMPVLVLLLVIVLSFSDGKFGVPALIGTGAAIALGPMVFGVTARKKVLLSAVNSERSEEG